MQPKVVIPNAGSQIILARLPGQFKKALMKKTGAVTREQNVKELLFLSRAATALLEISPEDDVYRRLGEWLKDLTGDSIVLVSSFDETAATFRVQEMLGSQKWINAVVKSLGRHPVGMVNPINDFARRGLTSGKLQQVKGIYEIACGAIPEYICRGLEELFGLVTTFAMGIAWRGKIYGSIVIFTREGGLAVNPNTVETLVLQTSIALQRRAAEQALLKLSKDLELKVKERTAELSRTNADLKREIIDRRAAEDRLRELSQQLVGTQDRERRAIGRELHDQTGQYLTALKLLLTKARMLAPENQGKSLDEAIAVVNELMLQVRQLSLSLLPPLLESKGLLGALNWNFERYKEQTGITVNFKHSGIERMPPSPVGNTAYRVIQEALTNAARYAGVKTVSVSVKLAERELRIKVRDRGKGFDVKSLDSNASGGLRGMRERVSLLGGSFKIDSRPGLGTTVTAEIPVAGVEMDNNANQTA